MGGGRAERGKSRTSALRAAVWSGGIVLALATAACGLRSSGPPEPGEARGAVPDLHGRDVMVLPAQRVAGVGGAGGADPDDEIAFALMSSAPDVGWIFPHELREALGASPGVNARIERLDVGVFLQAEVDRVGDPLFGNMRRLSALTGARLALIPVLVQHRRETEESPAAVEVASALLDAQRGYVVWFGVVEGSPGNPGDPAAMASAAEALADAMGF